MIRGRSARTKPFTIRLTSVPGDGRGKGGMKKEKHSFFHPHPLKVRWVRTINLLTTATAEATVRYRTERRELFQLYRPTDRPTGCTVARAPALIYLVALYTACMLYRLIDLRLRSVCLCACIYMVCNLLQDCGRSQGVKDGEPTDDKRPQPRQGTKYRTRSTSVSNEAYKEKKLETFLYRKW